MFPEVELALQLQANALELLAGPLLGQQLPSQPVHRREADAQGVVGFLPEDYRSRRRWS